jgi:hypothetical protein
MRLFLQRGIVMRGVFTAIFIFVLSLILNYLFGGFESVSNLIWPVVFSVGIGAFTSWQHIQKTKKAFIKELASPYWYIEVASGDVPPDMAVVFDGYETQLTVRGYRSLGNFITSNMNLAMEGYLRLFANAENTQFIEVQQIRLITPNPAISPALPGVHFSICSLLAGRISVVVTDHTVQAANYLTRGDYTAVATYPTMPLFELMEKHRAWVDYMRGKTGHQLSNGLTVARYLQSIRERYAQASSKLRSLSGWAIAGKVDKFEAAPKTQWATSSALLTPLEHRDMAWFDTSPYALPEPVLWLDGGADQSAGFGATVHEASVPAQAAASMHADVHANVSNTKNAPHANDPNATPQLDDATVEQIASGASWFYWIAALTVVGAVALLMGSNWGFAIGLGMSQVLTVLAMPSDTGDFSLALASVATVINIGLIGLFAWLGYVARRPSLVAFMIGMIIYVVDTLIFVIAGDWLGAIFHGIALYFLWKGWSTARAAIARAREII